MRKEIALLAGPRQWGDTRESWLSRVPRAVKKALGTERETVTHRMVKSLWYGEIGNPEHHAARDVRQAVQILKAREEAARLATIYRNSVGEMRAAESSNNYSADIARLERVARLLGGDPRS